MQGYKTNTNETCYDDAYHDIDDDYDGDDEHRVYDMYGDGDGDYDDVYYYYYYYDGNVKLNDYL